MPLLLKAVVAVVEKLNRRCCGRYVKLTTKKKRREQEKQMTKSEAGCARIWAEYDHAIGRSKGRDGHRKRRKKKKRKDQQEGEIKQESLTEVARERRGKGKTEGMTVVVTESAKEQEM